MNQPQYSPTPPVGPLVPQMPETNTAIGILNDSGLPGTTCKISGQPPSELFWSQRVELSPLSATLSTSHTIDHVIGDINVSEVTGGTLTRIQAPRKMLFVNSYYSTFDSKSVIFWAIKPPGARGKLRITYWPTPTLPIVEDALLRGNMWEWDLGASDFFEIPIVGNNPLGYWQNHQYPQIGSTNTGVNSDIIYDRGRPSLYSDGLGHLRMSVQNQYVPGGIFPDTITIRVFSKYNNLKNYVLTGPRCYHHHRLL